MLVCFPELHGTSKVRMKSCSSSPHLHLSIAACFQFRPAALTIPCSVSRSGLNGLLAMWPLNLQIWVNTNVDHLVAVNGESCDPKGSLVPGGPLFPGSPPGLLCVSKHSQLYCVDCLQYGRMSRPGTASPRAAGLTRMSIRLRLSSSAFLRLENMFVGEPCCSCLLLHVSNDHGY